MAKRDRSTREARAMADSDKSRRGENSLWKTKWEGRIPENEAELREWSESFVEYLEERYDLPPRGELATITKF